MDRLKLHAHHNVEKVYSGINDLPRVCLKRNNPQTQVDFASVQGRNPKA